MATDKKMAAAGSISMEQRINWTTINRTFDISPTFRVGDMYFHLQIKNGQILGSQYYLSLENEGELIKPVDVEVRVNTGTTLISSSRSSFNKKSGLIWTGIVPDVAETCHAFSFQVVFYGRVISPVSQRMPVDKSVQTSMYLDPKFELDNLSQDYAKMLEDTHDSSQDVQLVCGDRTWKAHSSILSARSDVFAAMLRSDMVEGKTKCVQVEIDYADYFQDFLQYLYSGRLPELTVDTAMQFYEMGDRYSVGSIKERCRSFLIDSLAKDNACAILSLADQHSDLEFRQTAFSYVLDENIPMYKEHWSDFRNKNLQLALEVYDHFTRRLFDAFQERHMSSTR